MSSFAEEVNPLEIPAILLKKKKLKPINTLETKRKFPPRVLKLKF